MGVIPLPELVVVLAVAAVVFGWQTFREVILRRSEDPQRQRARMLASCVLITIISIPLILRVVPPNGVYGFRNAETLSNRAIWYQANAFMGWALVISSAISAAILVSLPMTARRILAWAGFLLPLCGAIVASFVYLNHVMESRPF